MIKIVKGGTSNFRYKNYEDLHVLTHEDVSKYFGHIRKMAIDRYQLFVLSEDTSLLRQKGDNFYYKRTLREAIDKLQEVYPNERIEVGKFVNGEFIAEDELVVLRRRGEISGIQRISLSDARKVEESFC